MIKEQFLITYWRGKILQNVLWHIGNKHYISKADINIGEDRWKPQLVFDMIDETLVQ